MNLENATATDIAETAFAGLNSNCLVYLPSEAPEDIHNGIYGGTAPCITLSDGNDFHCPKGFKAKYISYDRDPKVWATTTSYGWQTIVLPFDVTGYKTEKYDSSKLESGEIMPITENNPGHFWLRELVIPEKDAVDNTVCFVSTKEGKMKGNTPYILSFPGEGYAASLQDEVPITFYASNEEEGCAVYKSENLSIGESTTHSLHGVYQSQTITNGWTLNGNEFEKVESVTIIAPFYAYVSSNNPRYAAFPQLFISNKLPTALDEQEETSAGLQVLTTPEGIVIVSSAPGKAAIRNAMGIVVSYLTLEAGSNPVSNLPTGVYFIEGQKFFVQ